jgi:hypothetical protein
MDIVLTTNGIHILASIIIIDPTNAYLVSQIASSQEVIAT